MVLQLCFSLRSFTFHSGPDTSTLLAQLMLSTTLPPSRSRRRLSSSVPPPPSPSRRRRPPLQAQQQPPLPQFSHRLDRSQEEICHGYVDHNKAYLGDSCGEKQDQIPDDDDHSVEDEDLHHSMPADCKHEDARRSECEVACDDEYAEHILLEENHSEDGACKQEPALPASVSAKLEAEDALSGFYDVGVLLKDQQRAGLDGDKRGIGREDVLDVLLPKEWSKMTHLKFVQVNKKSKDMRRSTHVDGCRDVDATCTLPYVGKSSLKNGNAVGTHSLIRQLAPELPCTEQDEMKEHLKFWARVVASDSHTKAVLQTRQLRNK